MKTKEEKNQKKENFNIITFLKTNPLALLFVFLVIIIIVFLSYTLLSNNLPKESLENDFSENKSETTPLFSIDKIICYSNGYGLENDESQSKWNLNLSQYTDIAIYLNSQLDISSMYIDNISFSNSNTGSLSLSYLPIDSFGKTSADDIKNSSITDKINLDISSPITLRYLNYNLKENCVISDTETPLLFDGSILKRGKITISSLKNNVSFNLHVTTTDNNHFVYPINIPINLENKDEKKSIYDGSYIEELLQNT